MEWQWNSGQNYWREGRAIYTGIKKYKKPLYTSIMNQIRIHEFRSRQDRRRAIALAAYVRRRNAKNYRTKRYKKKKSYSYYTREGGVYYA